MTEPIPENRRTPRAAQPIEPATSESAAVESTPDPSGGTRPSSPIEEIAGTYAQRAGVERRDNGQIDVLKTVGGIRGLAESIVPGVVFLVLFTIGRDLTLSLVASLVVAGLFTLWRLVQRGPATQAFSGLIGVGICALVAAKTGRAEDYYLWGFLTNGTYILGMLISIAVRWPIAGLLFGFIRGEGVDWRKSAARRRVYHWATWIIIAVLTLRLLVQVPLYYAENLVALGTTRLLMGVPLYALGLWMAWLISRPATPASVVGGTDKPAGRDRPAGTERPSGPAS